MRRMIKRIITTVTTITWTIRWDIAKNEPDAAAHAALTEESVRFSANAPQIIQEEAVDIEDLSNAPTPHASPDQKLNSSTPQGEHS